MLKDSGWWDFIASVKTSTNSDINTVTHRHQPALTVQTHTGH